MVTVASLIEIRDVSSAAMRSLRDEHVDPEEKQTRTNFPATARTFSLKVMEMFAVGVGLSDVLVGYFETIVGATVSALDVLNPTCGAAEPNVLTPVPPANAEAF